MRRRDSRWALGTGGTANTLRAAGNRRAHSGAQTPALHTGRIVSASKLFTANYATVRDAQSVVAQIPRWANRLETLLLGAGSRSRRTSRTSGPSVSVKLAATTNIRFLQSVVKFSALSPGCLSYPVKLVTVAAERHRIICKEARNDRASLGQPRHVELRAKKVPSQPHPSSKRKCPLEVVQISCMSMNKPPYLYRHTKSLFTPGRFPKESTRRNPFANICFFAFETTCTGYTTIGWSFWPYNSFPTFLTLSKCIHRNPSTSN